jgi:uncharacterized protein (TIGR01777 family)
MKRILITGGSGLVGTKLSKLLLAQGHEVAHLTREKSYHHNPAIKVFRWNIFKQTIDPEAIQFADVIIHLAGESVAKGHWSAKRKKEIIASRVLSTKLLVNTLTSFKHHVESFISASAIGIYGINTGYETMHEQNPVGDGFLAEVAQQWEEEVNKIALLGIRTCIFRIGIVLAKEGGALPQLIKPIKYWIGSPLGTGDQMMSWIHIDDLCSIFNFAIDNTEMHGVYNATAPRPVANTEMMQTIARKLRKPLFLPKVPAFILQWLMGEMSEIVLGGNKVSARKISNAGFKFKFPDLSLALKNLLK